MHNLIPIPNLTRGRIRAAYVVAILADAIQLLLGPLGWLFLDQVLDVIAMVVTIGLLGFHPLLLPTFLLELLPAVDLLPTWTASVAVVVALRARQSRTHVAPSDPRAGPVIDV